MGPEYSWLESGQYFGSFIPGPNGPPADIGEVTDIISSASVDATVENNAVAPQIQPGAPYQQPGTDAPPLDAQVAESTMTSAPGPNVIEPGAVFVQPSSGNPEDNPAIDASTAAAGAAGKNPMNISGAWSGNYIQPGS